MTGEQLDRVANGLFSAIKIAAPYLTGNLANNALKMERVSPKEYKIYISLPIAPYAPYVNEPWLSPRWNVKKNPNEHWWNDIIEAYIERDMAQIGRVRKL